MAVQSVLGRLYPTFALLLSAWIGVAIPVDAQLDGHVVSQRKSPLAEASVSADLDADGREDLVVASINYEEIVWHRNEIGTSGADSDGFGTARTIVSGANDIQWVGTANVDGSGGADLVLLLEDGIAWRKNQIGTSSTDPFGERKLITGRTADQYIENFEFTDLTGNGREDLVLLGEEEYSLYWFKNKVGTSGADTDGFGSERAVGRFADSDLKVLASDLNADGAKDLLVARTWFENQVGTSSADSDGFGSGQSVGVTFLNQAHVDDLDGDGDGDLVLSDEEAWYKNQFVESGSVEFVRGGRFSSEGFSDITFGDSDGDGDTDLFLVDYDDNLIWRENQIGESGADSDGFGSARVIGSQARASILVSTLNGDDKADLVATSAESAVRWYPSQVGSSGSDSDGFGTANSIQTPGSLHDVQDAEVADLDGDGDRDIVSASAGNDQVAWHPNQIGESGADSDGFGSLNRLTTSADSVVALATGDVDKDGDPDVFAAYGYASKIVWFENRIGESSADSDGFGAAQQITADITDARDIAVGDLDSDGDPDVISGAADTETIAWYENQVGESGADSDGFSSKKVISTGDIDGAFANSYGTTPDIRVVSADFNQDGKPDVAGFIADNSSMQVAWFANLIGSSAADSDGFGTGQVSARGEIIRTFQDLVAEDVNLNGSPDLVTTRGWYANRTQAAFPTSEFDGLSFFSSSYGREAKALVTTDWDADGDPDTALLGRRYRLSLLENQVVDPDPFGSSNVDKIRRIARGFADATSMSAVDLDGDFDPELLATSAARDRLVWFKNQRPSSASQKSAASRYVSGEGTSSLSETGLRLRHQGVGGSGQFTARRFSDGPSNFTGIEESSVSSFRVTVEATGSLILGAGSELRFDVGQFPGISNPGDVVVYHRPGPKNGKFEALPTQYDSGSNEIVARSSRSYGELVLASDSNPLPVELTNFEGRWSNDAAILSWRTASEQNTALFEVQRRSPDGGDWKSIGEKDASGTTTTTSRYRFRDSDVPYSASEMKYRLRLVETDGTEKVTDDITVYRRGPEEITLHGAFPNPVGGQSATVRYELPERGQASIQLYDMLGRQVETLVREVVGSGRHSVRLNVGQLSPGTYFLRMQSGSEVRTSRLNVVR